MRKVEAAYAAVEIAFIGRLWAEKLTRSVVVETVNAVDAVVLQSGRDAVNRFREQLERVSSIVRQACLVALTRVSRFDGD